jgi:hypothetical protein
MCSAANNTLVQRTLDCSTRFRWGRPSSGAVSSTHSVYRSQHVRESDSTTPRIKFGTTWKSLVNLMIQPLKFRKRNFRHPLNLENELIRKPVWGLWQREKSSPVGNRIWSPSRQTNHYSNSFISELIRLLICGLFNDAGGRSDRCLQCVEVWWNLTCPSNYMQMTIWNLAPCRVTGTYVVKNEDPMFQVLLRNETHDILDFHVCTMHIGFTSLYDERNNLHINLLPNHKSRNTVKLASRTWKEKRCERQNRPDISSSKASNETKFLYHQRLSAVKHPISKCGTIRDLETV